MVQVAALAPSSDTDGDRQTRIRTQVESAGGPASAGCRCGARSSSTRANSAELRQRVAGLRERIVGRLEQMYAPELSTLPDGERRQTC